MTHESASISRLEAKVEQLLTENQKLKDKLQGLEYQFCLFKDTHNYNVKRYQSVHQVVSNLIGKLKKQKIMDLDYSSPQELSS